jgi:hypothetical protein
VGVAADAAGHAIRVSEALTLERERVNFDSLLLMVFGKGGKNGRCRSPLSCGRMLFRHLKIRSTSVEDLRSRRERLTPLAI